MEREDYSGDEEWTPGAFQAYIPQVEAAEQQVASVASCFRRYREMDISGFWRTNAEYDWLEDRLTDYTIGWLNGYAQRRERFF